MLCSCFDRDGNNCIERVPIFSNLSQEEMLEVASITRDKKFDKGELVYMAGHRGEKLYVIHEGRVKISRINEDGKEQVIRILGPGEFMGELSIFSPTLLDDSAQALEDLTMCIIDGENLKSLMKKYPDIGFKVMEELSKRLNRLENLVEDINLASVEKRLAQFLISSSNERNEVDLNMSKGDLASHMGMSRETLSRRLRSFEDLGMIEQRGHRKIIIKNLSGLKEID